MKWWNAKKRSLGQYYFEDGCLQITLWGDVETVAALDMVATLLALKRAEIAAKPLQHEYSEDKAQ